MAVPPIRKGTTRGTVYGEIARLRMGDAKSLLESKRYNGAIYLAGYAVECRLKFAYCRRKCASAASTLPGHLEVHDWDTLVSATGLLPDIKAQQEMDALYSALVDRWGPSLRYRTTTYGAVEAKRLYNEIEQLYQFLSELVP